MKLADVDITRLGDPAYEGSDLDWRFARALMYHALKLGASHPDLAHHYAVVAMTMDLPKTSEPPPDIPGLMRS